MIRYVLDTCICIDVIRRRGERVLERLRTLEVGEVAISTITLAELCHGAERSAWPDRNRIAVREFCGPLEILPFDESAALVYGRVRARLERLGRPIGPLDMLIASHCLAEGATLVTSNEDEFRRVDGLTVENWL